MDDLGTVGGVPRLADRGGGRHGFARERHDRRGASDPTAAADRADVSAAAAVAVPLLRERTLAAARGAFGDAGAQPPANACGDGDAALAPRDLVQRLLQDVRRLAARAGAGVAEGMALHADDALRILQSGADDAEAVLHDVDRLDEGLAAWFAAVRAAMHEVVGDASRDPAG